MDPAVYVHKFFIYTQLKTCLCCDIINERLVETLQLLFIVQGIKPNDVFFIK